jgi:hypothetical protein
VNVVQPAVDLASVPTAPTSLSTDSAFWTRVGVPNASHTQISAFQSPRAGAGGLTVTITNSNPAVAQLVTTALTGQQVTVPIALGQVNSPTTVAAGGVAFHALAAGVTTVSAAIPGFITTTSGSVGVTVNTPTISLLGFSLASTTVGAGLQETGFTARLAATQHGGVTVHIASSNDAVAVVSPNDTTAGSAAFDMFVPNGSTDVSFVIQGVGGAPVPATVTITASAAGFTNASATATIVQPALQLTGLGATIAAGGADDPFQVQIGIPNVNQTSLVVFQGVRAGGAPLTVTVTHTNTAAAQLRTTASTAQTVTVPIAVRQSTSPNGVAAGGVALDPLASGQTTVSASIPGFIVTNAGSQGVTITP